jgi:hypothetical protein
VPQDILDFFDQFAQDIASKDRRRIARNYARAYHLRRNIFDRNVFDSPYPLLFFSSPPPLQYVHITKIRNGPGYRVQGYIEGSTLGEIRLPDNLYIVRGNGAWKWQRIVASKQTG